MPKQTALLCFGPVNGLYRAPVFHRLQPHELGSPSTDEPRSAATMSSVRSVGAAAPEHEPLVTDLDRKDRTTDLGDRTVSQEEHIQELYELGVSSTNTTSQLAGVSYVFPESHLSSTTGVEASLAQKDANEHWGKCPYLNLNPGGCVFWHKLESLLSSKG